VAFLYGRVGRLTAKNGGFRPGQGGLVADARGPRTAMLGGAGFFLVGYGGMYLLLRAGATSRGRPGRFHPRAPVYSSYIPLVVLSTKQAAAHRALRIKH
jgi:hypothetical protein